MKNKRFLAFYLFVCLLLVSSLSMQAQTFDYDPVAIDVLGDQITEPLAQNGVTSTITKELPNYQYNTALDDSNAMGRYGLVGFCLVTCLGLVVFTVKQDRKTMSEQTETSKELVAAIAANTTATKELALSIQSEIRRIGEGINFRIDSLEKTIQRGKES